MQELEIISQGIYEDLRQRILYVQQKVQKAVNAGMVQIYWEVGQRVDNACDGKRADYGKEILKYLSIKLTNEFGKAYSLRNLQMMRQFFRAFPNANTLCSQLSWSHYNAIVPIFLLQKNNLPISVSTSWEICSPVVVVCFPPT